MRNVAWLVGLIVVSVALAGCSSKEDSSASDGPEGGAGQDPSGDGGAGSTSADDAQEEAAKAQSLEMRGPGGWESEEPASGSSGGSGTSSTGSGGSTPPASSSPASSSPPASQDPAASEDPAAENATEPELAQGPSWDPFNLEGWTSTYGLDASLAGYRYMASQEDEDGLSTFQVDVQIGQPEESELRSIALSTQQLIDYAAAGGTATDPAAGTQILAQGDVIASSARVVPIRHFIDEMRNGEIVSQAIVTAWLPLDEQMPEGYWALAALHYEDGTSQGSWEYALGEQAPEDAYLLPYMAGASLDDLAAFDVLLTLYGVRLFAAYPSEGQPLPSAGGEVDALGYVAGGGFDVMALEPIMVADNATGGALPFTAFEVQYSGASEEQEQSFRLVLGVGMPLPKEVGVEVVHPQTGAFRVMINLEHIQTGLTGLLPPAPDVGSLPASTQMPSAPPLPSFP